jgi:hypothetical protein
LNKPFQDLLKREGIQFQVCKNPDIKCSVIERVNRTLREKLYKYYTYKNTYTYIDVLDKFVKSHNDTLHTVTGLAASKAWNTDILTIWNRMRDRTTGREVAVVAKCGVGQHVRISRENIKFTKVANRITPRIH